MTNTTKVVPVEPTEEMIEAFFESMDQRGFRPTASDVGVSDAAAFYKAMLNAAPLPVEPVIDGNTSDGYHTFNELYAFRLAYNAALFNEWASAGKYQVHKATKHFDGDDCFGGGWFIVVAMLPEGQISNHYKMEHWDKFQVPAYDKALFEYDGHTGADTLKRLYALSPTSEATAPTEPEGELQRLREAALAAAEYLEVDSCDDLLPEETNRYAGELAANLNAALEGVK